MALAQENEEMDIIDEKNAIDDEKITAEEMKNYKDDIARRRLRQLEYLEKQLAGFSQFSQMRKMEQVTRGGRPRKAVVSVSTSKSIHTDGVVDKSSDSNNNRQVSFTESPPYIKGQLKPYQVDGLNWLISLYEKELNGILADEMGLGKTVQSISMIGYLQNYRNIKGPHLVVVPLQTLSNWIAEFQRFMPSVRILKAHCYQADLKALSEKMLSRKRNWDVVITGHQFIHQRHILFRHIPFEYVILDEGHRAKNENTLLSVELRKLNYRNLLLLTGTPIHNSLHELWALLNLMNPQFFHSANDFDNWFRTEECIDPQNEMVVRLKNLLKPLMLRRVKDEVDLGLPPKIKTTIVMAQTEKMRYYTEKLINRDIKVMRANGEMANMKITNLFAHLRKVTLHPFLIPGVEQTDDSMVSDSILTYSSKMIVLDKLLTVLKRRRSRVLIFSQYVIMLNIVADYMDWRGHNYRYMNGETNIDTRNATIAEYNAEGSKVFAFLITTRTGGLGINLHTADTVIFLDQDWNPQSDLQAEDRAHRIGQTKPVHVFRLVVQGTVEESMHDLIIRKRMLDNAIVNQKNYMMDATNLHIAKFATAGLIDVDAVDAALDDFFMDIDSGKRGIDEKIMCLKSIESANNVPPPPIVTRKKTRGTNSDDLILTHKRRRLTIT